MPPRGCRYAPAEVWFELAADKQTGREGARMRVAKDFGPRIGGGSYRIVVEDEEVLSTALQGDTMGVWLVSRYTYNPTHLLERVIICIYVAY